ncbi:Hypothetical protein A7982_07816 [Minicystis rosea]|nr:Hypothetical protein A7982_07816 [Minicystis rosea]
MTDAKRLYSIAFDVWQNATPAQKQSLRGISPELLAIGVARARKLAAMSDAHEARADADEVGREAREAAARAAFSSALTLREQAVRVMRGVAGRDEALLAKIAGAVGTAESGAALAKGLSGLASVAHALLAPKKGPIHTRAKLMRFDADYVASIEDAAARVGKTAAQAGAKSGGTAVTQGALDREDGVNARILGHVIEVFEAAHDIDPTIPRLVPIATRRLFGRHQKVTKPAEGAADADEVKAPHPDAAAPTK